MILTRAIRPFFFIVLLLLFAPAARASEGEIFLRYDEKKQETTPLFLKGAEWRDLSRSLPSMVESGDRVRIDRFGQIGILAEEPESPTVGKRGVMIVSLGWSGSPPPDIRPRDYAGLTRWSKEASADKWSWDPVTVLKMTVPGQSLCDANGRLDDNSWSALVRRRLQSAGYNLVDDYGALGLVFPEEVKCIGTAYAYLGCQINSDDNLCGLSVFSEKYISLETVIHELGHTLGLPHAQSIRCEGAALLYGEPCTHVEYGDRHDPMGSSFSASMYNPSYSATLGWKESHVYSKGEVFRLRPWSEKNGKALQIPLSLKGYDSPGNLYVEYRDKVGIDETLWSFSLCSTMTPKYSLFIRLVPSAAGADMLGLREGESYLLDLKERGSLCFSALEPGERWTDRSNIQVHFQGVLRGEAHVSVDLPGKSIDRPRARVEIEGPGKRILNRRSLVFRIKSSRPFSDSDRSDIYLRRGKCRLAFWREESRPRQAEVFLHGCRSGRVQIGLRDRSLRDDLLRSMPEKEETSGIFYLR